MHVVNELKQKMVDVRRCLLAISLTTWRLDNIYNEVLHYFSDLFFVAFPSLFRLRPNSPFTSRREIKIDVWKYLKTILMGQFVEFCDDHKRAHSLRQLCRDIFLVSGIKLA